MVVALVALLTATGMLGRLPLADAAPLPPAGEEVGREADLGRVVRVLEGRVVAAHLRGLGLDRSTVETRLARLDDAELHRLALAVSEAALGGQDGLPPMSTERKLGTVLILLLLFAVVGAGIYLAVSGF
jgi:hypothetical protein